MKPVLYKDDVKQIIMMIILGIIGLGLSVLFIYLYSNHYTLIWTILTSIFSLGFMIISLLLLLKNERNIKIVVLFPTIYLIIIFLILCFVMHKRIFEDPKVLLDCLMWSIYCLPSFIIVVGIAILLLIGAGSM